MLDFFKPFRNKIHFSVQQLFFLNFLNPFTLNLIVQENVIIRVKPLDSCENRISEGFSRSFIF